MQPKDIARAVGLQERTITQALETYDITVNKLFPKMQTVKAHTPAKPQTRRGKAGNGLDKHSYVKEFCKIKDLKEFRAKDAHVNWFVGLVASGRFSRGEQVRDLPDILENSRAKEALERHGHEQAMKELQKRDATIGSPVFKLIQKTTSTLKKMGTPDLDRIKNGDKEKKLIEDLFAVVKQVGAHTGLKLK